ncbi:phosphatidylglycerophosphatase A [Vibrio sp. UCD-FRSSP16_10]|uniref:phosphatidylglycerophosphatase A n=1 Tax=unclassified Vibrio TaxID=2614977 RepID=UPI0007FED3A8|nr:MULTISPECIES: phosphatidylglycerophosphatase A [unclassified Vibrio]OBT16848.1 phosphatidylglycerophosphatase A [Vibrio sp. UCD-FRSSP16_30]OBT21835.1 phosphatidylglycerophosphatase A [Vibrio sp. UCD-FRSSP16_10]
MSNPLDKISLDNPWHLFATGFGSGLSPIIPGTMGTLASIPLYLALVQLPLAAYSVVVLLSCIIGIKICSVASKDMGVHDHGSIVWDEFAGFWITMLVVPIFNIPANDWHWLLAGFVLFRFFDMVKPWPISYLDKQVHGGLGIMIDDIVAGVMAGISLAVLGAVLGWY